MSRKQAYDLLLEVANFLETAWVEQYSCKDAEKNA